MVRMHVVLGVVLLALPSAALAAPDLPLVEAFGRVEPVTQSLERWKEAQVGSKVERTHSAALLKVLTESLRDVDPAQAVQIRAAWAHEILPVVLAGVPKDKAKFLLQFVEPFPPAQRRAFRAGEFEPGAAREWDVRLTRALVMSRVGWITDASNEHQWLLRDLSALKPSATVEVFGQPMSMEGFRHVLALHARVLRASEINTMPGRAATPQAESSQPKKAEAPRRRAPIDHFPKTDTNPPIFAGGLDDIAVSAALGNADGNPLAAFEVRGNDLIAGHHRDRASAELGVQCWKRVCTLVPARWRHEIIQFNVLDGRRRAGTFGGSGANDLGRPGYRFGVAAYACREKGDLRDVTVAPARRRGTLDWTIVHEMGHYICLKTNAIEMFWDEFEETSRNPNKPVRRERPDDYPEDGTPVVDGNFVTSYAERAAADEDTVESFTAYILLKQLPTNDSRAARKIRFFEKIPGMKDLRDHVQSIGQ